MPFPDEIHPSVSVVDYQPLWPDEFELIAGKRRWLRRWAVTDWADYGQIKAPATQVLIAGAERWARETG